ncbi:MAG TPA: hypothetical protein VH137_01640, partial [Gemmatimonadales bacterium]|nr:hypothetical protein [Gemmatimonadales bacterium]
MNRTAVVGLGAVLLVAACRDAGTPLKPSRPSFALFDGSNGGNEHFFFLPPIVAQPSFSGTFNPQLAPVVQICMLDSPTQTCVANSSFSPGAVQLDPTGHYQVNWDTGLSPLVLGGTYRITVLVATIPLGFVDVEPVSNGSQLKNLKTGDVFGLVDGRTVPIKFRIELGAFGTNCATDCAEATVTNAGGTVLTNTGFAGVQFPNGWLASPSQVVVTIERVTTVNGVTLNDAGTTSSRCIPILLDQFEGCYRFQTQPQATFATFVTVGMCIPSTVPVADHDAIQLFQVEEPVPTEEPTIHELRNVPAPFVSCEGFASTPLGFRRQLPGRLLEQMERLLTPTPAYAFHLGAGGLTCCFSRIGWVLPTSTPINFEVDPNGATIGAGTVVNATYTTQGVTFSRTAPGAFCGVENNVYANNNGPLTGGGFGVVPGNNVVTICPEGTSSDFSETSGGRI